MRPFRLRGGRADAGKAGELEAVGRAAERFLAATRIAVYG